MTHSWQALAHGPIERLEDNLWTVAAELPGMPLRRRMTIVKLADGRLVVLSAVPLAEATQRELEAWGEPAFIVVPGAFHLHGAPLYKARYPKAEVLCGDGARARATKAVEVAGGFERLPRDPSLEAIPMRGCRHGEHAFVVRSGARSSLVFNDVVFNHPHVPGFGGNVLRWVGSSGGPRVTFVARTFLIADKPATREHLLELADTPGLARLVVSHVDLMTDAPAERLRSVARTL